eukprot:g77393.t1
MNAAQEKMSANIQKLTNDLAAREKELVVQEKLSTNIQKLTNDLDKSRRCNARNKQVNADLRKEITDYKKQLAEYVENASNDADLETVENKLREAEANVKQLTTALQKAESNAAKYLEKYNDAKVQLVSLRVKACLVIVLKHQIPLNRAVHINAPSTPTVHITNHLVASLIVSQTTLKQRALIALNINANNHSHHKSSDSEYDCESDYSKTKSPHCSKHRRKY